VCRQVHRACRVVPLSSAAVVSRRRGWCSCPLSSRRWFEGTWTVRLWLRGEIIELLEFRAIPAGTPVFLDEHTMRPIEPLCSWFRQLAYEEKDTKTLREYAYIARRFVHFLHSRDRGLLRLSPISRRIARCVATACLDCVLDVGEGLGDSFGAGTVADRFAGLMCVKNSASTARSLPSMRTEPADAHPGDNAPIQAQIDEFPCLMRHTDSGEHAE
jgi:hypothetical protein